jgi:methyltransferase (TIGR00027 family)
MRIDIVQAVQTTSSQTARTAAAARAAHLIVDQPPVIFSDTLAVPLLGAEADEYVDYHRAHGSHVVLAGARGQVVCRSRLAEDSLAAAIKRGVRQYVILGAGLDSFAYRSALSPSVTVFEVDHAATQAWKRHQLAAAGITVPENVTFVAADFETGTLAADLIRSGLDSAEPAFVSWLGVTMYLTAEAIGRTFAELSLLAPGSEVVADYMLPAEMRDDAGNTYVELVGPSTAERGEPWLTFLSPADMSRLLARNGLRPLRHVAQRDVGDEATWHRSDSLRPVELSLIAHATVATC